MLARCLSTQYSLFALLTPSCDFSWPHSMISIDLTWRHIV